MLPTVVLQPDSIVLDVKVDLATLSTASKTKLLYGLMNNVAPDRQDPAYEKFVAASVVVLEAAGKKT
jgi:hypothetical protein